MSKKHVLLIGSGAVGVLYASRLGQSKDVKVSVVVRSDWDTLAGRDFSFTVDTKEWGGTYHWQPYSCYQSVEDAKNGVGEFLGETQEPVKSFDYVLIATKVLPQVFNLVDYIKPVISPNSVILLFQNGLDIERDIVKAFPNNTIAPASVYVAASRKSPGIVQHFNVDRVLLGLYQSPSYDPPKDALEKVEWIANQWKSTDTNVSVVPDVEAVRVHKNLWNAVFGAVQIVTGLTTDKLMSNPELYNLCKAYLEELWQLSIDTLGSDRFPPPNTPSVDAYLEITKTLGPYKSSIFIDYEANRPTEVDCILAAPWNRAKLKFGDEAMIRYARLHTMYALVKSKLEG